MSSRLALDSALTEIAGNVEQTAAVHERDHCVVLAGPGSGKTRTLTTAMVRTLVEDVEEPRGVACITYNNECAIELESRLKALGLTDSPRVFVGTVHSFAFTQVVLPYARCISGFLPSDLRVASATECRAAVEVAYANAIGGSSNPHARWRFAEEKRRRDIDRTLPNWSTRNPELGRFIEAYEAELRRQGLIDFDDMPLIAFRMIRDHEWIRSALRAKFPVLFVDEYQDLGHALHELVLLLCFEGGIRLFGVGDVDQSIYSFAGANPELLEGLAARDDVRELRLRFNYRSSAKIIRASMGALGEERDYEGVEAGLENALWFYGVEGNLDAQAAAIAETVLPNLLGRYPPQEVAVLYRDAQLGNRVSEAFDAHAIPYLRSDKNALIKRSSRTGRFVEACAQWVAGGWQEADPSYARLLSQAKTLVFGRPCKEDEERALSRQLITFLREGIGAGETIHSWLHRLDRELFAVWRTLSRNPHQEWELAAELIEKTDPAGGNDMPLNVFAGRIEGAGRVSLSTLHSAKGREFDAVILYGLNADNLPNWRDNKSAAALREARRLFYVGVTRPRKELVAVHEKGRHSPWLVELSNRSRQE